MVEQYNAPIEHSLHYVPTIHGAESDPQIAGVIPLPTVGTTLGSGRVVGQVGEGGMTRIYKIWNEELEQFRAVKLMKQSAEKTRFDRFRTEAKVCAQVDNHNSVRIYSVGSWEGLPLIEMEHIDGPTVQQLVQERGGMPAVVSVAIALGLCKAVEHIHAHQFRLYGNVYKGILHRDIKPANVMITCDGTVKLMDFGIARPTTCGLHTVSDDNILGTMQYIAPELFDGAEATAETDVYGVGLVLYELLVGSKAFDEVSLVKVVKQKSTNSYKPFSQCDRPLDSTVVAIAERALHLDRGERYCSAASLRSALVTTLRSFTTERASEVLDRFLNNPDGFIDLEL